MTEQLIKQIKKVLKNENVEVCAFYYDRAHDELRVKVEQFILRSGYGVTPDPLRARNASALKKIVKVLRALERNSLRPEYKTEQRETTNALGTWDCRYIIFK